MGIVGGKGRISHKKTRFSHFTNIYVLKFALLPSERRFGVRWHFFVFKVIKVSSKIVPEWQISTSHCSDRLQISPYVMMSSRIWLDPWNNGHYHLGLGGPRRARFPNRAGKWALTGHRTCQCSFNALLNEFWRRSHIVFWNNEFGALLAPVPQWRHDLGQKIYIFVKWTLAMNLSVINLSGFRFSTFFIPFRCQVAGSSFYMLIVKLYTGYGLLNPMTSSKIRILRAKNAFDLRVFCSSLFLKTFHI